MENEKRNYRCTYIFLDVFFFFALLAIFTADDDEKGVLLLFPPRLVFDRLSRAVLASVNRAHFLFPTDDDHRTYYHYTTWSHNNTYGA